jgi:hypothetical protein
MEVFQMDFWSEQGLKSAHMERIGQIEKRSPARKAPEKGDLQNVGYPLSEIL